VDNDGSDKKPEIGPRPEVAPPTTSAARAAPSPFAGMASAPVPSLPKPGGAIRGIGEKFSASAVTGTGSLSVPIAASPGRAGFQPALSLDYDSGVGNGVFGAGWHISVPHITRRTDHGLPRYRDRHESDVFILSGMEDLVPLLDASGQPIVTQANGENVVAYRPRVESGFARIERHEEPLTGNLYWTATTRDNVTSVYGKKAASQIVDPAWPRRIFTWLLEQTTDDRGNVIVYEYKPEDLAGVTPSVSEGHRLNGAARFTNQHLKRIRYGNTSPGDATTCVFELVFDYGEHDATTPTPEEVHVWPARQDPFSSYRAGFEVRTYRLCRRVLVFHTFAELGATPCLVASTDLGYDDNPILTKLSSVTHRGYIRDAVALTYTTQALPPVTFGYSPADLHTDIRAVDAQSLTGIPAGVDGAHARWVDLDGEGIPGVLLANDDVLAFKRNLGGGMLAPARTLPLRPRMASLSDARQQITDLDGDGRKELAIWQYPMSGFHERTDDDGWTGWKPFRLQPMFNVDAPMVRFIDLTGDGREDLLFVDDVSLTWFPSLGRGGYGHPTRMSRGHDEDRWPPRSFYTDTAQAILLADMTGDGLPDIVRVKNGSVCYWPNLGYGVFGAKVTLANAPQFDRPDRFDPKRIRLGDIDGSGTTDILYLHPDGVRFYANQSGNALAPAVLLPRFPSADDATSLSIVDLLGSGTACLVWSSPHLRNASSPMRYMDLHQGRKPHLLTSVANNLGLTTTLAYTSSTTFYLADLKAGVPWVTKLPFPVQVLAQVETYDAVSKVRLVRTYAYHHGYYDGVEREFRGFGMVEERDAESFSPSLGQGQLPAADMPPAGTEILVPPVVTKTWFHTGYWPKGATLEAAFATEYFRGAASPPPTTMPSGLGLQDAREAARALKGQILRQEVYAEDGSAVATFPYSVSAHSYEVRLLQSSTTHAHASFFNHPRETIDYHFERKVNGGQADDARITHSLVLDVDPFGAALRSAAVAYPRNPQYVDADKTEQAALAVTVSEVDVFNSDPSAAWYRLGVPLEERGFELLGLTAPSYPDVFAFDDVAGPARSAAQITHDAMPSGGQQKRLLSQLLHVYLSDDLSAALAYGTVESLALAYQSYAKAFTAAAFTAAFGSRATDAMLADGGYVQLTGDLDWWIPSPRQLFSSASSFYLPSSFLDPFGNATVLGYDGYKLLVTQVTDPVSNVITSSNDYRILGPTLVTDPNGNQAAAQFDELRRMVATAVMGKVGSGDGDTLADPTVKVEYTLDRWQTLGLPNRVHLSAREQHGPSNPRWQESYSYSDGSGHELMKKVQAEPGSAPEVGPDGKVVKDASGAVVYANASTRWVGTGRTVVDNKGNPVKKYEPYFSANFEFEDDTDLVNWGVTPILRYDPLGRLVRTDLPNGTYTKSVFDAWHVEAWDPNDTVADSLWYAARSGLSPTTGEGRAAALALAHAGTPDVTYLDAQGRTFLAIQDNAGGTKIPTRTTLDVEGNSLAVTDARGNAAQATVFAMNKQVLTTTSCDAGQRWTLSDVMGQSFRSWDSRGTARRTVVDPMRRPIQLFVQTGTQNETLAEVRIYGERVANADAVNLRGKPYQVYDGAGVVATSPYDFKGNLLTTSRQVTVAYQAVPDWSALATLTDPQAIAAAAQAALDATRIFGSSTTYDALNRPTSMTAPDQSLIVPTYSEANLLQTVSVNLHGAATATPFVTNVDYNEKGQRVVLAYANGATTTYTYDPLTFRLTELRTTRAGTVVLQDLSYTYDPVGNITEIVDDAQQTVFFNNAVVSPSAQYIYDAIYRLTQATGRELAGGLADVQRDQNDLPVVNLPNPNDTQAVRNYIEAYAYDAVGNILAMQHVGGTIFQNPGVGTWTRHYAYDGASNRLLSTSVPGDPAGGPYGAAYGYDAHGNMTTMPHLPSMGWDFKDQLQTSNFGGGGSVYFLYDAAGQRVRKVWEHSGLIEERIYVGGFEVYRKSAASTGTVMLERQTLHVMDGVKRIALVETTTADTSLGGAFQPSTVTRFQLGNHLGSAVLEVDETGAVISYEEYHPFGTTSYSSGTGAAQVSLKRYRYTGKEKDAETGLYYHGARYYAPWLGRWTRCDPGGLSDSPNLYQYALLNPVVFSDPDGSTVVPKGDPLGALLAKLFGRPGIAPSSNGSTHVTPVVGGAAEKLVEVAVTEVVKTGPRLALVPPLPPAPAPISPPPSVGGGIGPGGAVAIGVGIVILAGGAWYLQHQLFDNKGGASAPPPTGGPPPASPTAPFKGIAIRDNQEPRPADSSPQTQPATPHTPSNSPPQTASPTEPAARVKFTNLEPQDKFEYGYHPSRLEQVNGKWWEVTPEGKTRLARGEYNFITTTARGKLYASKISRALGADHHGHVDLSAGGDISYGGQVTFKDGKIQSWNNGSGHYRPDPAYAHQSGLDVDKFDPVQFDTPPQRGIPVGK